MSEYVCRMPYCGEIVLRRGDVCEGCWTMRRVHLLELPDLYVRAYALLTPGSQAQALTTIHVSRPAAPVPFSLVIYDALEGAYATVLTWATYLCVETGMTLWVRSYVTGKGFAECVKLLREYDSCLANRSYVGDYVYDLYVAYRRLVTQTSSFATRRLSCACPSCDGGVVLSRNADEYAVCLTCGATWGHSQIPLLDRSTREVA